MNYLEAGPFEERVDQYLRRRFQQRQPLAETRLHATIRFKTQGPKLCLDLRVWKETGVWQNNRITAYQMDRRIILLDNEEQNLLQVSRLVKSHFGRIRLDLVRRRQKARYISYKVRGGEDGLAKSFIDHLKMVKSLKFSV